jgi:hypothetical protein
LLTQVDFGINLIKRNQNQPFQPCNQAQPWFLLHLVCESPVALISHTNDDHALFRLLQHLPEGSVAAVITDVFQWKKSN